MRILILILYLFAMFSINKVYGMDLKLCDHNENSPIVKCGEQLYPDKILVLIPGALSSVNIFDDLVRFSDNKTLIIAYRLPGLDGYTAKNRLIIKKAALVIKNTIKEYTNVKINIIGFSTGSAVALSLVNILDRNELQVALISSALPTPNALFSGISGLSGILNSAVKARSINLRSVWLEYYKTLVYGKNYQFDAVLSEKADSLIDRNLNNITFPENGLIYKHSGDLISWRFLPKSDIVNSNIVFYHGVNDSVFSLKSVKKFSKKIPGSTIKSYNKSGHLVFVASDKVFSDIARQFKF